MLSLKTLARLATFTALTVAFVTPALAQDKLKLAIGQRGNWDTSVSEIGTGLGIFKKHNIELEMLYTQGGGETQQAVIAGSADIGIAAGVMGVLSAYSKGAPVRIIGAETTGGNDLFWYVKADSPIKSLKETDGKTIAYSTNGSSTHGVVNAFMKEQGLKARPTATGGPAATLTQVMSGQIDVGWSAPPFGLEQLDKSQIRIIATGNDAVAFKGQTVRINITNVQTLQSRRPVIERYMRAYRETVEAMYSNPAAMKHYAEFVKIPDNIAKRVRDDFFPKEALDPDTIVGLDMILPDAVALKYISQPLTREQLSELIQIPRK
jgi:NitT/TauT family transport system substrate-binding protein